jgi:hypothetical protein
MTDRPSMETMIKRYEGMREEVFAALSKDFGSRDWRVSLTNDHFGRSGCNDDPLGEVGYFPTMFFPGAYDEADWKDVSAVVERVGREHGFDDAAVVVDRPGDFEVVGEDEFGARFEFGMAKNTTFGMKTGCHRWDHKPSPSP